MDLCNMHFMVMFVGWDWTCFSPIYPKLSYITQSFHDEVQYHCVWSLSGCSMLERAILGSCILLQEDFLLPLKKKSIMWLLITYSVHPKCEYTSDNDTMYCITNWWFFSTNSRQVLFLRHVGKWAGGEGQ